MQGKKGEEKKELDFGNQNFKICQKHIFIIKNTIKIKFKTNY